ncbi:MAG TPA: MATE family efflux transporter [Symbiobacteriaceae bacterium]|nr:MATE family efflux transporter [Symbiobacteriaceae bacterium]
MAQGAAQALPVTRAELIRLSWPIATENLFNMTLMWVDSIIINHRLGTESFAAVQMSGQLMNVIGLILAVVASGASVVISHQVGAGERREAGRTADQSAGAGLLVSVALGALVWLGAPMLLRLMGAEGTVHTQGVTFMRTLALFMPAMGMLAILGAILRATGDTRGPMTITLLVNVLNVALNFLFVWGIPALHLGSLAVPGVGGGMGLFGSALGTSIARAIGALLMLLMVLHRSEIVVRIKGFFDFGGRALWRVGRMGLPGALEWISWQSSQLVVTALVARLGTAVIAARGITAQTEMFTYVPAVALGTAASIMVGHLMGARRRDEAVATGRRTMSYGMMTILALSLFLLLFPRQIAGIFTSDPEVLKITGVSLRIAALYKAGQCLNIVCGGIYRGAGNPQWPTVLTTIGTWLLSVPLAFLFVRLGYGLAGVLVAQLVDETVRGAINLWYFTTPRWRFRQV